MPLASPLHRAPDIETPTAPRAVRRVPRRRARFVWALAAVAAALLCALVASSARAGTYDVAVCGVNAHAGSSDGLSVVDRPGSLDPMNTINRCSTASPGIVQQAVVGANGGSWNGDGSWTLRAPANTTIESLTMTRTFAGFATYLVYELRNSANTLLETASIVSGAGPIPANGPRTLAVNASSVTGRFFCVSTGLCHNATGTSVSLTGITPRIRDTIAPTLSTPPSGLLAGSLFAGGPVSGTRGVLFDAFDQGGGVYRVALLVDGVENQSATPDTNGGRCVVPFEYLAPCPTHVTGEYAADTTRIPEGEHQIQLAIYDATDTNQVVSEPQTVLVDNVPAPSGGVPALAGTMVEGQPITASPGTWQNAVSFAYETLRCNAAGTGCAPVATGPDYTLGAADVGHKMRVRVTATNSAGETTQATSAATALVLPLPPVMLFAPSVLGGVQIGQQLASTPGTWTSTATVSYTYRWARCSASCEWIAGATEATYTPGRADVLDTLQLEVTAINDGGATTALSAPTDPVPPIAPSQLTAPSITGTPRDRLTLTAHDGTFDGAPEPAITRLWERCDEAGVCSEIAGATDSTYTADVEDVGYRLRLAVTATNPGGSLTVHSPQSAPVEAMAPVALEDPSITGPAIEGRALDGHAGVWDGTPTLSYEYRWVRCDDQGQDCTATSATDSSYSPVPADVGHRLRLVVTASNAAGPVAATSAPTEVIAARPPTSTLAPSIDGDVEVGETLTASSGTWEGTEPISLAYQWSRCDPDGNACDEIPDATASIYLPGRADVGHTLRVVVTAGNVAGEQSATSAATGEVPAIAPTSTRPPAIDGDDVDGATLHADDGTFDAEPAPTTVRAWERCDETSCTQVADASGPTYTLGADDIGTTIQLAVTARNRAGEITVRSVATPVVEAAAPRALEDPTVVGEGTEGIALSGDDGEWSGTAPIARTVVWMRCSATGEPESCRAIDGATDLTYMPQPADIGHRLRLQVTGQNAGGQSVRLSDPTQPILGRAPVNTTLPTIAGETTDGQTLTATPGTWTGTAEIRTEPVWLRCSASGGQCASVATGDEYALGRDDVGSTLRVRVRAINVADEASATSAPSALVLARAPRSVRAPELDVTSAAVVDAGPPRTVRANATVTVTGDLWDGTADIDTTVVWERCAVPPDDGCAPIANATGRSYDLGASDAGTAVRAQVIATNAAGSAAAYTTPVVVARVLAPGTPEVPRARTTTPPASTDRTTTRLRAGTTTTRCSSLLRRVVAAGPGALRVDGALHATTRIRAGRRTVLTLAAHDGQVVFKQGPRTVARASGVERLRWTQRGARRLVLRSDDDRLLVAVGRNAHHKNLVAVEVRLCTTSAPALERARVLAGRAGQVRLTLSTAAGRPIQQAVLRIDDLADETTVRTDAQGRARVHLSAGGSGSLRVTFEGDATRAPATLALPVDVVATTTLRLVSGSVPATGRVAFTGRLRGNAGDPSRTRVRLSYRSSDGRWHPAGTARVDRRGRWHLAAPPPTIAPSQAVVAYRTSVQPGPRYPYVTGTDAAVTFHLAHRSGR